MAASTPGHSKLYLALGVLIAVWGVFGMLDVAQQPYVGYLTDGDNNVIQVAPGGPAAEAGIQMGDRLQSIRGVPVEDTPGQTRLARPEIGDVGSYDVGRGGETLQLELEHAPLPAAQRLTAYGGLLIGFCFLAFGLWAYVAAATAHTNRLAVLGFLFGFAFLGGPYLTAAGLRLAVDAIVTSSVLLGFAVLLHFLVAFPEGGGRRQRALIYGPVVLVALIVLAFLFIQPPATSALNVFFRTMFGILIAGYFGLSVYAVIRTHRRASPEQRGAHGLGLMLLGTVVGLVPLVVAGVLQLVAPRYVPPGAQYWFLTLILIPATFAFAAVRSARRAAPPATSAAAI